MDCVWVNTDGSLCHILHVLLDDLRGNRNDMLALPVLDQIQLLKCAHNIFRFDGSHFAAQNKSRKTKNYTRKERKKEIYIYIYRERERERERERKKHETMQKVIYLPEL